MGSDRIRIISPVDGTKFAERSRASEETIAQAIRAAASAQAQWRAVSLAERAALCRNMVEAMVAMKDELAPELAWQMGRPVRYGAGEIGGFEERARYMIDIAAEALGPIVPPEREGFRRRVERRPLGTVLVVAPWNYPYLTAVNSVIPALMAGNAVLLKHASQTLLVGERFQQAFDLSGMPTGLFHNLVLDHEQTARLLRSREVNQVNFTGSVRGGEEIEKAASGSFLGVGLELGGKDPAYVRSDASLEQAVEGLVDGAFFNSGQSCCGIERIYVDRAAYSPFVDAFVETTRSYVLGNPLSQDSSLGPMARASAADAVRLQVAKAVASGARGLIEEGTFAPDEKGSAYLAPQVLVDVDHSMAVMQEETFGPTVGIMAVDSEKEAIHLMNDSRYGLTASIWTQDVEAAERIGDQLETGTVYMNRCDYLDPALAWTGVKDTGRGATLSRVGYETLTRPMSFHFKLA